MADKRIVFMGTGDIAIPSFQWLIESGHKPLALVTQPDRPAGRRRVLKAPEIKLLALEAGVEVLQPEKVRDEDALAQLKALKPDLIVVMAYGQILPQSLIDLAPLGCVNLHASLLPKYRGAACIQAAIDAGDAETGVTLMHVVKALDAGDVILAETLNIGPGDTGGVIHDRLADTAVAALAKGLPSLLDGKAPRIPQGELGEMSHVSKLGRDEGRIDWAWSAERIERRLRAYDPWPGCWAEFEDAGVMKRIKVFPLVHQVPLQGEPGALMEHEGVLCVACGENALRLADVQPDGSRRMAAGDWWRGARSSGLKGLS